MIMFKLISLPSNNIDDHKSSNQDKKYFKLWIYVIIIYGHFIDKGDYREE